MEKTRRDKLYVLLVAVLLTISTVALALLLPTQSTSSGGMDSATHHQVIEYHSNNGSELSYSVDYYGIASSEYNPEYWAGSFSDVDGAIVQDWTGPAVEGTISISGVSLDFSMGRWSTYEIVFTDDNILSLGFAESDNEDVEASANGKVITLSNDAWIRNDGTVTFTVNINAQSAYDAVFAGWNTSADGSGIQYYPGDVIPGSVTDLYATWVTPSIFNNVNVGTISSDVTINDSAFELFTPYKVVGSTDDLSESPVYESEGMYSTIYCFDTNLSLSNYSLPTGTYRSLDPDYPVDISLGRVSLAGDAIFDNLNLMDSTTTINHGDSSASGLFANGHVLIMGLGIGTQANSWDYTPQIIGGSSSKTISSAAVSGKTIVSNSSDDFLGSTVDLGTYVIIHSGIYQNVVAGGIGTSIGSAVTPLSTYLVMKGGTVLDTIIGGSGGNGSVTAVSDESSVTNEKHGGTFMYLLGCNAPGDDYEEIAAGYRDYQYYIDNPAESIGESTIIEGGGSSGIVRGSSHVFLSDEASVWDVQAGGRRSSTSTTYAYMEISGNAIVKHLACGTITDGNSNSGNKACVGGVHIVVEGSPKIASLFGAGYDTWSLSNYSSFIGRSGGNVEGNGLGIIDVDVYGGTIGYLYGGGYRGSIGTDSRPVDVDIEITGGTILQDVFGGGRGGLEKVLHMDVRGYSTSYGEISNYGNAQTTGQSFVYGDIRITIGGTALVNGSVYGGGESVPIIDSYTGFSPDSSYEYGVAKVVGDVTIDIQDSSRVLGSVFGAGKGIELDGNVPIIRDLNGDVITDNELLMNYAIIDSTGALSLINWAKGGVGAYKATGDFVNEYYLDYAKIEGSSVVNVVGGQVHENVYGGGAMSVAYGTTTVDMTDGTVMGDIFGGGLGTTGRISGTQDAFVAISDSATVNGNVYGGAAYGLITGPSISTNVDIGRTPSDVCSIGGSVFGGGKGVQNANSVVGTNNVNIIGGDIGLNVYGASEMGITVGNTSVIIGGGEISGSVFGGGKGAAGYDSVVGGTNISVSGGTIVGNLYAGSEFGIITGDTYAILTSGVVNSSIYGGGLGTTGNVSVRGKRNVVIDGISIIGSVYGGSSYGDDVSNSGILDSNSLIVITSGSVGSIYGGGFKGKTYGNTAIYIGYSQTLTEIGGKTISISGSIYGGGDVGELSVGDEPFTQTLVQGNASIFVNGNSNSISFTGSMMGSGNSCLTGGETYIEISSLYLSETRMMESIHRVDRALIIDSDIYFEGRAPGVVSTRYSFYEVGDLSLMGGSSIHLFSSMDNVYMYRSLNEDGNPTMSSSPSNTVCLHDGMVFDVKSTVDGAVTYGLVHGYSILSIITTEDYYGAFAFGSLVSPGGFVVEKEGSYKPADSLSFVNCKCWFIAGVVQRSGSVILEYDPSSGTYISESLYIDLPKISSSTSIRYTGSYFTSSTTGAYSLVEGTTPGVNQYSVLMGADDGKGSDTLVTFGEGQYLSNTFTACNIMGSEIDPGNVPQIYIQVIGHNNNFNTFLGCATITFQEVVPIEYQLSTGETVIDYVIYNVGEVNLDMYAEGEDSRLPDMETTINTVNGVGEATVHIPENLTDTKIYIKSFETSTGTPVTISSKNNRDNNLGWSLPLRSFTYSSSDSEINELLGTLNGGYYATIAFNVSELNNDTETYVITFTSVSALGVTNDFVVTIHERSMKISS